MFLSATAMPRSRLLMLLFLALPGILPSFAAAEDRLIIAEYQNRAYATKGLLTRTLMEDSAGRPFTETKNQYTPVIVADGAAIAGQEDATATVFVQLTRTDHAWFEERHCRQN